jgi:hypothetical protein
MFLYKYAKTGKKQSEVCIFISVKALGFKGVMAETMATWPRDKVRNSIANEMEMGLEACMTWRCLTV